jgi:hypothetical protein
VVEDRGETALVGLAHVVLVGVLTIRHQHDDLDRLGIAVVGGAVLEIGVDLPGGDQPVEAVPRGGVQQRHAHLHAEVDRGPAVGL